MKIKRKKVLILTIFLLFATGFLIYYQIAKKWDSEEKVISFEEREKKALEKGIEFLLTTDVEFGSGVPILVKLLNETCNKEDLEYLWSNKVEGDFYSEIFLTQNHEFSDVSTLLKDCSRPYCRLFAQTAFCEHFTFNDFLKEINQLEKEEGYNSAHTLSFLVHLKKRDCFKEDLLSPLIEELVEESTTVQDKEGNPENLSSICALQQNINLYAERSAFIGYAGYPIKKEWSENIINCQLENGSWYDSPYSTVFAVWTIAQSRGECK